MAYRVELTEPALRDMEETYLYISKILKEPGSAERIYFSIRDAVLKLEKMPERYPVIDEPSLLSFQIRKMLVENYIVFYQVDKENSLVTVVRVLYNRREWQSILGEAKA